MFKVITKLFSKFGRFGTKSASTLKSVWTRCSTKFAGFVARHPKIWNVTKFMGGVAAWAGIDWVIQKAVDSKTIAPGEVTEDQVIEYANDVLGFLPPANELIGQNMLEALEAISLSGNSIAVNRAIDVISEAVAALSADGNLTVELAVRYSAVDLFLRRFKNSGLDARNCLPSPVEITQIMSWYTVMLIEEMAEADPDRADFYQRYIKFHFADAPALSGTDLALVRELGLPDTSSESDLAGQRLGNHYYNVACLVTNLADQYDDSDLCELQISLYYAYLVAMAHRAAEGKLVTVLFS